MLATRPSSIVKRVASRLTNRHAPPDRLDGCRGVIVERHTILKELLLILQHLLRHLAQVEEELTTRRCRLGIDEGIHHPELNVLDIGRLKVALVYLAHHTAPVLHRVGELTIATDLIAVEVVRTTLIGIVSEAERLEVRLLSKVLISIGK